MEKVRKFGMRDKMGYMFGDFGNDFFFILVASFLMVFYTDVFHISPAAVGTLFLIARLWDAVADVTWGRFIDTRNPGKRGKFIPWIFRMSFPLVISGILMFVHIPGMGDGFYLAYAYVTYILWGTLYSTVNIPYGSMASVITADPNERTALSTYRTLGANLAGLVINVAGPLILFVDNEADANRFLIGAIIFGALSISCYMACVKLSTERIVAPKREKSEVNFGNTIKALAKNKPLIWILLISLIFLATFMLIGAVNVFLFKDYFSNASALSIVGFLQTGTIVLGMPMVQPLVAKFGKKEVAAAGAALAAVSYSTLYLFSGLTLIPFIVILTVAMFGYAFFNLVIWAFVTDVIDYHEYITGLREDGTIYSIYSFARKVGQALAGGISGYALAAIGYNSDLKVQSTETLSGIHMLATLIPALVFVAIFLMLVFLYPLNKKRTLQLALDLEERRNSGK